MAILQCVHKWRSVGTGKKDIIETLGTENLGNSVGGNK